MVRISMLAALVMLIVLVPLPAQDSDRINDLIGKLGSESFSERERARQDLERLGVAALEALRKATESDDLETRGRAAEIVRKIEENENNNKLLAPKRIHLKVSNLTVIEAVAELERASGYTIHVTGDRTFLQSRKITLDTGETSFWRAFDALCATGGLVEQDRLTNQPAPNAGIRLPVQVLPAAPNAPKNAVPIPPIQIAPLSARTASASRGILIVSDGNPRSYPTSYSGAVRVRLASPSVPQRQGLQADELALVIDVDAEPRLQNFSLAATPQIDKAIDDAGQSLPLLMDQQGPVAVVNTFVRSRIYTNQNQIRQQAMVRLKRGEKPARVLRDFTGTVSAQALTLNPEAIVVVRNILNAAGQSERSNGYMMQVNSVSKLNNGDIRIDVSLEGAALNPLQGVQVFPGGGIQVQQMQIQIGGNVVVSSSAATPTLVDANGKSFRLSQIPSRRVNINNNVASSQMTMVFSPVPGQGEPDRLVLTGPRQVTLEVPFAFKDVPLD